MPTLDFVSYGENSLESEDTAATVERILGRLEEYLMHRGRAWSDVSLLLLADSVAPPSHDAQQQIDRALKHTLTEFCSARGWFPSLIGASVYASFFTEPEGRNPNIIDGFHFVAICSDTVRRVPVAAEVGTDALQRRYAGRNVVDAVLKASGAPETSTILLFEPPRL